MHLFPKWDRRIPFPSLLVLNKKNENDWHNISYQGIVSCLLNAFFPFFAFNQIKRSNFCYIILINPVQKTEIVIFGSTWCMFKSNSTNVQFTLPTFFKFEKIEISNKHILLRMVYF